MSTLGDFLTGMVQRSHQGTQDRAALNTLAQFSDDQDSDATDKLAQRGKQASALRNVIKSYSDNPDLGHAINSLGVDDLEGIMHGMALGQAQQEMQARTQEQQAQAAWLNQRTTDADQEGNALSQFASTLGALLPKPGAAPASGASTNDNNNFSIFGGYGAAPAGAPAAPEAPNINGAVLSAMAEMGRTNPKMAATVLGKFLPAIMQQGGETASPSTFVDKTTGAHFAILGKSIAPAGYDPAVTHAGEPQPQHDADGNLIGFSMTDMHGHSTFHAAKGSAKVKQLTDADGNPIEGYYMTSDGKTIDTRTAMDKIMGSTATPGYKSADDVKADFKAGKIDRDTAKKILADKFGMK